MSKMLRNYQYLVDPSTRRYPGDDLNEFVTGAVTTAVTNLVGLAPEDLDTLGELASAMQNNPDFLTTLQGHDADLLAAIGIDAGARNIGEMNTTELPDAETVKALFEAIGEAARRLREGLGVAQGDSDLGTFTGSTIADASSVKTALQAVETAHEAEVTRATAAEGAEVTRATGAESALSGRLDTLEADPTTQTALDAVALDSANGDSALDARLIVLEADPTTAAAVAAVQADVDQNEADADAAIATERARIDAILLSADADKDSFAEIVTLINSVDTANDDAFAAYVLSNDAAVAAVQADVDQNELDGDAAIAAVQADVDQNELDGDAADAALSGRLDVLEADPTTATALSDGLALKADLAGATFAGDVIIDEGDGSTIKLETSNATSAGIHIEGPSGSMGYLDTTNGFGNDSLQIYSANTWCRAINGGTGNLIVDGTLTLAGTALTATFAELNFVDGVTSSIQTQLNAIQADVDQNEADADAAISAEENARISAVSSEASARQSADTALSGRLDVLETDPTTAAAVAAVQADVDQNEADADAAIALKLDASAVSAFGLTLVDDADAATARTTLGLDASTLRSILGITENAGDPADGRGMYYDTTASKYLLSS